VVAVVAGATAVGAAVGAALLPHVVARTGRTVARHPVAERVGMSVALGVAWGALAWHEGTTLRLAALLVFAAAGVALSVVDLREKRIPNAILLVAAPLVLALTVADAAVTGRWEALLGAALGSAGLFVIFLVLALLFPRGMGMGDVKLAALLGFVLGGSGWGTWIVGFSAGILVGGLAAAITLLARQRGPEGTLPYGPALVIGALIALLLT